MTILIKENVLMIYAYVTKSFVTELGNWWEKVGVDSLFLSIALENF